MKIEPSAVRALLPPDLVGDDGQGLVPADALVLGDPAVLRIARAVRIEVDPLHRVQQPLLGIGGGLHRQRMGRDHALAAGCEFPPARLDGPAGGVLRVKLDRRDAHDAPVAYIHEQRAAVGHVGVADRAVGLRRAEPKSCLHHEVQGLHPPDERGSGPVIWTLKFLAACTISPMSAWAASW